MLGCTLPSFFVILAIALTTANFQTNPYVQQFFTGVLAAVTALILMTAIKMARRVVRDWITALLAIAAVILVAFFRIHALLVLLGGAVVGLGLFFLHPALTDHVTGGRTNSRKGPNHELAV
jgi:chromate transporter